ncbi:type II secretion system F family protein [Selenomonas sp. GACV-9]|uniref:type II secretion system F family protein n=1 Tax=Selenomonas sp. GACV-9 TaxID=3158782 RepID=UPI0015A575F3
MTAFAYEARNRTGELFTGEIRADSRKEAAHQIRAKGLWVASLKELKPARPLTGQKVWQVFDARPAKLEVVLFCRQLAVLLSAGLPVHEALGALRQQSSGSSYQRMLEKMLADVMQGKSLHEAMGSFPQVFSVRMVSLVKAGELAGSLDGMFSRLADFMEKSFAAREKLRSVLLYPFILGVTTFLAFVAMTVFILPTFAAMLANLQAQLPLPTRILLQLAAIMQQHGGGVLLLLSLLLLTVIFAWRQPRIRVHVDRWRLQIPFYGRLASYSEWLMLLGTLAVLLENGIRLHEALQLLPEVTDNFYLREVIAGAHKSVERGRSLVEAWRGCQVFPAALQEMVMAGEKSGELEFMLKKGAELCAVIAENESQRLQAMAEPAAIFLVGSLVFFFVLSVILPLLEMMDVLM